jgi:hypothetical protein
MIALNRNQDRSVGAYATSNKNLRLFLGVPISSVTPNPTLLMKPWVSPFLFKSPNRNFVSSTPPISGTAAKQELTMRWSRVSFRVLHMMAENEVSWLTPSQSALSYR